MKPLQETDSHAHSCECFHSPSAFENNSAKASEIGQWLAMCDACLKPSPYVATYRPRSKACWDASRVSRAELLERLEVEEQRKPLEVEEHRKPLEKEEQWTRVEEEEAIVASDDKDDDSDEAHIALHSKMAEVDYKRWERGGNKRNSLYPTANVCAKLRTRDLKPTHIRRFSEKKYVGCCTASDRQ